jgi:hypothetical protein
VEFERDFYAVMAQVLPAVFIAISLEFRGLFPRDEGADEDDVRPGARTIWRLALLRFRRIAYVFTVGEAASLFMLAVPNWFTFGDLAHLVDLVARLFILSSAAMLIWRVVRGPGVRLPLG